MDLGIVRAHNSDAKKSHLFISMLSKDPFLYFNNGLFLFIFGCLDISSTNKCVKFHLVSSIGIRTHDLSLMSHLI